MKNYGKIFFIFIVLLFIVSCPSEIVRKTYWKGEIDGDFGEPASFGDSHDLEIYIHDDGTCKMIVDIKWSDGIETLLIFDGEYASGVFDYSIDAVDVEYETSSGAKIKADFHGTLDTSNNVGNGKFEFTKWGSVEPPRKKADWSVRRIY